MRGVDVCVYCGEYLGDGDGYFVLLGLIIVLGMKVGWLVGKVFVIIEVELVFWLMYYYDLSKKKC